jgi:hypothetical protein
LHSESDSASSSPKNFRAIESAHATYLFPAW